MKRELPIKPDNKIYEKRTLEYLKLRKQQLRNLKALENSLYRLKALEKAEPNLMKNEHSRIEKQEESIVEGKKQLKEMDETLFGKGFNLQKIKPNSQKK